MLREEEWLCSAKRLAVGMRDRILHGHERRKNLVIANDVDKWWCYCQACKHGAVVNKEHVLLGKVVPKLSTDLTQPLDVEPLTGNVGRAVVDFLARKHMDPMYIYDPIGYSPSRKRIVIDTPRATIGRDITEKSNAKWLVYRPTVSYLPTESAHCGTVVVVEDAFSWYKVQFAVRGTDVSVVCALGTSITDALVLHLLNFSTVLWCFDGDDAGAMGAARGYARMRAMGRRTAIALPPLGLDPKDLNLIQIRNLVMKGLDHADVEG